MSENDENSEHGPIKKALRTATPPYHGRPNTEMDTIGWAIFLGLLILFVPLLPVLILG